MPRRITQVESMEQAPSRWATGHRVAESWTLFGAGLQVAGRLTTGWPESRTLLGAGLHAMRAECIQLGLGQRHASGNCTSTDEPSEPCVMTRTVIVQHHRNVQAQVVARLEEHIARS